MATAESTRFRIRAYRPGDETAQVEIYNAAIAGLPGFKAATIEEIARRYRAADFDPGTKLYAEIEGRVVGYVSFSTNGRMSVPWCRADAADVGGPLMHEAFDAMKQRGMTRARAAYRADWTQVLDLLESYGFRLAHHVINLVVALAQLPRDGISEPMRIVAPLGHQDLNRALAIDPTAFGVTSVDELSSAWFDGPYLARDSFFGLYDESQRLVGAAVIISNPAYADPTKIDSGMPCFRLGAIGTESERTKRVNGLFSYVARPGADNHRVARLLLSEASRRFEQAGIVHVAAQCRSDRPVELAFYDANFQRQKSFPVWVREL